jgi:hypothetical protein
MKKIPIITIILWLIIILGYKFFPDYILKDPIQYPLVILISIFLPVSFWLKNKERERYFSLIFIVIFFLNIASLLFALESNYSTQKALGNNIKKGIIPEIAELLSEAESIEKRQFAARFIYQNHGVSMPYKSSGESFILYSPSKEDEERYRENSAKSTHLAVVQMNTADQMLSAFFLLILHVGIFLLLIIFLSIYEQ